jgi:hypothetical protein
MNVEYINGKRKYDPKGMGTKMESGWFTRNECSNFLFEEAFSWHWHNSSNKISDIEDGSKFDLLRKIVEKNLKERNLMLA